MAVICDYYIESNRDSSYNVSGDGGNPGCGQCFVGNGGKLNSVKFYLYAYSPLIGNAYAKIYEITGNFGEGYPSGAVPTGSAIAVSDSFDVSQVTNTYSLKTFNFSGSNQIILTGGHYYCVMLEYDVDATENYLSVGCDVSSPTHGGNAVGWFNFGTYYYEASSSDVCFYVYTDDLITFFPPHL